MFQNVINGNPVVVGCNPPMKEYVEPNGFGVCVDTDGSDVDKIVDGLKQVISSYDKYKNNIQRFSNDLMWNSQNDTINQIVDKLLK